MTDGERLVRRSRLPVSIRRRAIAIRVKSIVETDFAVDPFDPSGVRQGRRLHRLFVLVIEPDRGRAHTRAQNCNRHHMPGL